MKKRLGIKSGPLANKLLGERGIKPEELPVETDISTLERKIRLEEKKSIDKDYTLRLKQR